MTITAGEVVVFALTFTLLVVNSRRLIWKARCKKHREQDQIVIERLQAMEAELTIIASHDSRAAVMRRAEARRQAAFNDHWPELLDEKKENH